MSEPIRLTDEVVALLNVVMPMGVDRLEEFGSALQAVVNAEVAKALVSAAREMPGFDSIRTHGDAANWLRDRAASIESGAQS